MSGSAAAMNTQHGAAALTTVPTQPEPALTMPDGSLMGFNSDWSKIAQDADHTAPGAPSTPTKRWRRDMWKTYLNTNPKRTEPDQATHEENGEVNIDLHQQIQGDVTRAMTASSTGTVTVSIESLIAPERPSEPGSAF